LVHSEQKRVQGIPERSPEVPKECSLFERPPYRSWNQCYAQWLSSTVVFERPKDEEFVRKWQLACERNMAHVVVMPSVTVDKLDNFLDELVEARSIWYKDEDFKPPCLASDIGSKNCCFPQHRVIS